MPVYTVTYEVTINGREAVGNMDVEAESEERAIEWATHELEAQNTNDDIQLLEIVAREL